MDRLFQLHSNLFFRDKNSIFFLNWHHVVIDHVIGLLCRFTCFVIFHEGRVNEKNLKSSAVQIKIYSSEKGQMLWKKEIRQKVFSPDIRGFFKSHDTTRAPKKTFPLFCLFCLWRFCCSQLEK